jgi:hypothetical protein
MNMLDMHTREKANRAHLVEMHRRAHDRYLLGDLNSGRIPAVIGRKIRLVLIGLALILLAGIFLLSATVFLILQRLG